MLGIYADWTIYKWTSHPIPLTTHSKTQLLDIKCDIILEVGVARKMCTTIILLLSKEPVLPSPLHRTRIKGIVIRDRLHWCCDISLNDNGMKIL